MDRRSILAAGMATVVAVGPSPFPLATAGAAPDNSRYSTELDAIDALAAHLNAVSESEAEWDRWEAWSNRVYREIESLPHSPENAKLKARAIWSITNGNMEDVNRGESTVCRLIRQIVSGLAGSVHHG